MCNVRYCAGQGVILWTHENSFLHSCIIAWFPALRGDQKPGYAAPSLPKTSIVRCYAATDYGQQAPKSEIKGG